MTEAFTQAVLLFDGVCNLCNGTVQFVIKRDPRAKFRFAALQSKAGQALLKKFQLPQDDYDSFVFVEGEQFYLRSTAGLKVLKGLNGLWPLLYGFIIIPRPIRDFFYRWIAKNRYRWFGKKEQCMIPTPDLQKRFLK